MIAVLNYGSQYNRLILRRIRELGVYCELLPFDISEGDLAALNPEGIILSGGPASVGARGAPPLNEVVLGLGVPILGICYGMQLLAKHLGASLQKEYERDYGPAEVRITPSGQSSSLMQGLSEKLRVWMSHGDSLVGSPPSTEILALASSGAIAAIRSGDLYGVQYHPEVTHTEGGKQLLENFVRRVCACSSTWTADEFVSKSLGEIAAKIVSGKALCALSGGVDSAVAATLAHRVLGDRLECIFVDTGLLRDGEGDYVRSVFQQKLGMRVAIADESKRFLSALEGVVDPTEKRKIIGKTFIQVFEEQATYLGDLDYLIQGTLYPDVVESGKGGGTDAIKLHHNVGGLPDVMKLCTVEPLRFLFKDEVRRLGRELGLPDSVVNRQPFPGPGFAVRISGAITAENVRTVRLADRIVVEEVERAGLGDELWQYFCILLPIARVCVRGDAAASPEYTIVMRAVKSEDGMTAEWARLPAGLLDRISHRITAEVDKVSTVLYEITSKPPSTIEWE